MTEPTHAELLQINAELRGELARAVRLLYFAAGREAAADPGQSYRLIEAADELMRLLDRTAP